METGEKICKRGEKCKIKSERGGGVKMEAWKWNQEENIKKGALGVNVAVSILSLGAVKIMDCHAKWPDTRGQRGWLARGAAEEGHIV